MEDLKLSLHGTSIHIEGFPDAFSVLAVQGPKARRLADLALHQADLEFANKCLDSINLSSEEPRLVHHGGELPGLHKQQYWPAGASNELQADSRD